MTINIKLSQILEKILKLKLAFFLKHPRVDQRLVVIWQLKQIEKAACRPRFHIGGAVNHAVKSSVDNGACTHGAGLQRNVKGAARQPPSAKPFAGGRYSLHLCVSKGITQALAAVATRCDNLALAHNNGAHGHLAIGSGLVGQRHG